MNLTGRPPYQKGSAKKKSKAPTAAQKRRREKLRAYGCTLTLMSIPHCCYGAIAMHHCGTGGGGRKNHDKQVPLCWNAHQGPQGIDRKGGTDCYTKASWQETFTTEDAMLEFIEKLEAKGGPDENFA